MGINTIPQPPYYPDLAPSDFCLFPKLTGCRYETIEEMKEAVTKVIDTLTQEDFHGAFQKLLQKYNKCIAAVGDYFEGDLSFMCVLSIKVPIRKKSGNLSYATCISLYFKQTFTATFQCKKSSLKKIFIQIDIIFAYKKTFWNFYFSANFSLNLKKWKERFIKVDTIAFQFYWTIIRSTRGDISDVKSMMDV